MFARAYRALLIALVLVAVMAPATHAQGVGLVTGRVTDERGVPLQGATLTLNCPAILGDQIAVTNQEGRYWFRAVPGSQPLVIRAVIDGRVPTKYVGYTARRDGSLTVDFKLRQPGDHEILVLLDEDVPYHRIALEGATSTMPGQVTTFIVGKADSSTSRELARRIAEKPSAVLAIGERAGRMARRQIRDVPVVHAMVPAPEDSDLTTTNLCGVPLNGGFKAQLAHLKYVAPEARRVGTIYNPKRMGRVLERLRSAAEVEGLEIVTSRVYGDDTASLVEALARLEGEPLDAFLLLLDPKLVDAERFGLISQFATRRDLVLAVPDMSLTMPGKSFCFVPGFWNLGAYAGTLVRRILEGDGQPAQFGMVYPSREDVTQMAMAFEKQSPAEVLRAAADPR
jgi:putative ABC transport system substrate-binding protein